MAPWVGALGVIGIIYGALVRYPQKDMKRLVAYSSVSHLGLRASSASARSPRLPSRAPSSRWSTMASRRAPCSSSSGVLYERRHTREIAAYGGIAGVVPVTTALFLVATFSSIGLPGLNGFVGEFLILARDMDLPAPVVGRRRRDRGDPVRDLHADDGPARLLESARPRGEPDAARRSGRASSCPRAVLVVLMVWIGVRPNDVLDRIRPSVDALQTTVNARPVPGRGWGRPLPCRPRPGRPASDGPRSGSGPEELAAVAPEIVLAAAGCLLVLLDAFAPRVAEPGSPRCRSRAIAALSRAALRAPAGASFGGRLETSALTSLAGLFIGGDRGRSRS